MADTHADQNTTRHALDELAALFLTPAAGQHASTENTEKRPHQAGSTRRPGESPIRVEALLLGHLPGFASPWVGQYAQQVATRLGQDVAIAWLGQSGVDLDRVRAQEGPEGHAPDRLKAATLDEGLAELNPKVGAYLVVITDPERSAGRRMLRRLPHWTLLTAADEAAVVGAYRMLKALRGCWEGAGEHKPRVQMAFAGCDEADAAAAMSRLSRATSSHLGFGLQLAAVRKQMAPARRYPIGRFGGEVDPVAVLLAAAEQAPAAAPQEEPAQAQQAAQDGREPSKPAAPTHAEPVVSAHADDVELPPAVTDEEPELPVDSRLEPAAEGQPHLASYVEGNVRSLAARCPRWRAVELALDQAGRLHLLRHAGPAERATDAAFRELMEVRAWAIEHAEVLALTCDGPISTDVEPQLHLFTHEPAPLLHRLSFATAAARRLLTLHLLKPIDHAGGTMYAHAALN